MCATKIRGMTSTRWWKYVERLIGDDTYVTAADKAGFDKSAFTRWKSGAKADPLFAIKLARAYLGSPLEALVEAGHLEPDEVKSPGGLTPQAVLASVTNTHLADEVRRRLIAMDRSPADKKLRKLEAVPNLEEHPVDEINRQYEAGDVSGIAAQDKTEPLEEPENP